MEKITFDQLQEELYHEKMANGLDVIFYQKKDSIKRLLHLQRNMVRLIILCSIRKRGVCQGT